MDIIFQRPAKDQHRSEFESTPEPERSQSSFLKRKVFRAASETVFEPSIIDIHELPSGEGTDDASNSVADERQSDLELAETVRGFEYGGEDRDDHLPDGVVDCEEEDCE